MCETSFGPKTLTLTLPPPGGGFAVTTDSESMVTRVAKFDPNSTPVPFTKPEPMIVTTGFPPAALPASGTTPSTFGFPHPAVL